MRSSNQLPKLIESISTSHRKATGIRTIYGSVLVSFLSVISSQSHADVITATTESELRAALDQFVANGSGDTINLDGAVITLSDTLDYTIQDSRPIGISNGTLRRDPSSPAFRLISIRNAPDTPSPSRSDFANLTLENGDYDVNSGPLAEAGGGAIYTEVDLIVRSSTVDSNRVTGDGYGGAIFSVADALNIDRSSISNNTITGTGFGGAIFSNGRVT